LAATALWKSCGHSRVAFFVLLLLLLPGISRVGVTCAEPIVCFIHPPYKNAMLLLLWLPPVDGTVDVVLGQHVHALPVQ
jgi:hypothetical protein